MTGAKIYSGSGEIRLGDQRVNRSHSGLRAHPDLRPGVYATAAGYHLGVHLSCATPRSTTPC
jgi:hypothetical protein